MCVCVCVGAVPDVERVQMEPWSDKRVWQGVIQRPVEAGCQRAEAALLRLLQPSHGGIMWRTSKNSVAAELGIPAQVGTDRPPRPDPAAPASRITAFLRLVHRSLSSVRLLYRMPLPLVSAALHRRDHADRRRSLGGGAAPNPFDNTKQGRERCFCPLLSSPRWWVRQCHSSAALHMSSTVMLLLKLLLNQQWSYSRRHAERPGEGRTCRGRCLSMAD